MLQGRRILIVLPDLELGGAERQALLLARYLIREEGASVQIWGFNRLGRTSVLCQEYGIPWRLDPFVWCPGRFRRVQELARFALALRQAQPDVVLPYTLLPNVVCGLTWRTTGARSCIWNQRDRGIERNQVGRKVEGWAIRQTPWFVSNSPHGADYLADTLGVKREKIRVIRNGIELDKPLLRRAEWRQFLGVGQDDFLVCMIANLHSGKDHVTLLKAWHKVVEQLQATGHQAVLLLAGRPENMQEKLKALAFDLDLGKSVCFLGVVDDIAGLLEASDLGVFSSKSEGSPNGVLECMAAGLAVIGTDIPGVREAVSSENYSFLVPPGDVDALASRMMALIANKELRGKLGSANSRRVRIGFNPQLMCRETVGLISQALRLNPSVSGHIRHD